MRGLENAREITRLVAQSLDILPEDVLPSSTGVIGQQLPIDTFRREIKDLREQLLPDNLGASAQAIMTTDTRPKITSRRVGNAVLAGMAKGSGMIEPNMATMLSFLLTDAAIPPDTLRPMLHQAVEQSFTSTSDTTVLMANGLAGEVDLGEFQAALNDLCIELAKEIARDGEGATKLLEVAVTSARDDAQAKRVAKAIVNSPLMKTAVYGADPNWGRVAMAIGKCHEERDIRPHLVTISFGDTCVYAKGEPQDVALEHLEAYLHETEVRIAVDLGLQNGQATVWGCDMTEEYIRINALYTT
jgi:glutamate N-acetyltransferase/amino-acid N-acetyltransferase